MREAASEIKNKASDSDISKVKEIFQHEKYDSIGRSWKRAGMVLCTDPSVAVDDLFDPNIQEKLEFNHWVVDFSLSGIDGEGWTYGDNNIMTIIVIINLIVIIIIIISL